MRRAASFVALLPSLAAGGLGSGAPEVQAGALIFKAKPIPLWACPLGSRPKDGGAGLPSGSARADWEAAVTELADARNARNDALKLHNFSGSIRSDEGDAKALLGDATRETYEAERLAMASKAEAVQQVESVGAERLAALLSGGQTVLVTFYARWCGHCQHFVMYDSTGDPEQAPLEQLNRDLVASKGPKVVKFDIDADAVPSSYDVQFVPTIFLVDGRTGARAIFEGDPQEDLTVLKNWALGGVEKALEDKQDTITILARHQRQRGTKAKVLRGATMLQVASRQPIAAASWGTLGNQIAEIVGIETPGAAALREEMEQELEARDHLKEVAVEEARTERQQLQLLTPLGEDIGTLDAPDVAGGKLGKWLAARPSRPEEASSPTVAAAPPPAQGATMGVNSYMADLA